LGSGHCTKHLLSLGLGQRCTEDGCNVIESAGGKCAKHRYGGMPRCTEDGCNFIPRSGGKCGKHCVDGGKQCSEEPAASSVTSDTSRWTGPHAKAGGC
jgi:hypothetical protein